ncbi:MAG: rod shape-determining protein MreD [Bacteroidetes bacterium]|nr:rod shape-determining protein MreD [Bacteroidota bacterium]
MSNFNLKYILQFMVLILIQVLILDHILFLGYINPYLYILFILALPINLNRVYILLLGFALGLCIDLFNNTGGVHAASTLFIAYFRPFILRLSFGISYDYNTLKLHKTDFKEQFLYVVIMVFIHHLLMFSLEYFSINYTVEILKNTLLSGIFSSILIFTTLRLIYKA